MRAAATKRRKQKNAVRKQLNIRIEPTLYRTLVTIAGQERRSVPQAALHLIEEGLRQRMGGRAITSEDVSSHDLAALAEAGGAFAWLAAEPDLYDDTCGEPL